MALTEEQRRQLQEIKAKYDLSPSTVRTSQPESSVIEDFDKWETKIKAKASFGETTSKVNDLFGSMKGTAGGSSFFKPEMPVESGDPISLAKGLATGVEEGERGNVVADFLAGGVKKGIGALKTIGEGLDYISPARQLLGDKSVASEIFTREELEPKNKAEKSGAIAAEIISYLIPGTAAAKWSKGVTASRGLLAKTLATAGAEGATAAGVSALNEGELNKNVAISGALGAAFPIVGGLARKAFSATGLMKKALGLPRNAIKDLDNLAKEGGYKSVDDFALQKGFSGSREGMVEEMKSAFDAAKADKSVTYSSIIGTVDNNYDKLFQYLKKEYRHAGLEDKLDEIVNLSNKPKLTAQELERMRYLADETLPRTAYMTKSPTKIKGTERMIDDVRDTLAVLDKSGVASQSNADIRILYKMIDKLDASSKGQLLKQIGWSTALRGGPSVLGAMAIPGAREAIIAANIIGAITDIPEVASSLAQLIKKLPSNEATLFITNLAKAMSFSSATQTESE